MAEKNNAMNHIPKEKFRFIHEGERLTDKKFEDKPIGYFKDAWIRFRKSRASVVGALIIIFIILYAFLAPLFVTTHDQSFLVDRYAKKPGRLTALRPYGIFDGGVNREFSEKGLITQIAIGMGAEDKDGTGKVTLEEGMASAYQPMLGEATLTKTNNKGNYYSGRVDTYLEVGFIYIQIEQADLAKLQAWEQETGLNLLYPLINKNEYNPDATGNNANYWYKMDAKFNPVVVRQDGSTGTIRLKDGMTLVDNYKRDADGNPIYWEYIGGGDLETAGLRVRVLYYNYYQYLYGFEPNYLFGTDSSGYDLALRIAGGIQLSLLIAVVVCLVNFVLGAIYGAIEGYYGGIVDMTLERVSDILAGVPFIIVATLFQMHLKNKLETQLPGNLSSIVCLLFAYVLTGWIGTASRVRTQFYRFKNQEYVMAARTLGARDSRIIWKHIFPNTLGTLITSSALAIPSTIMSESMLSFLGIVKLGGPEGTSLGTLLSDASSIWNDYPHLMLFPALVISLLMISFNLFGNGLRDAFNPSLRGVEE